MSDPRSPKRPDGSNGGARKAGLIRHREACAAGAPILVDLETRDGASPTAPLTQHLCRIVQEPLPEDPRFMRAVVQIMHPRREDIHACLSG